MFEDRGMGIFIGRTTGRAVHFLSRTVLTGAVLGVLTGCASGGSPASSEFTGVKPVALTTAQSQVVEDGVKQMVLNPGSAELSAVSATTVAQQPGVHVCGFVKTKDATGKEGADLPFYVELRELDGKPVTERGQVGSDPSKISKIKFVCRRNG